MLINANFKTLFFRNISNGHKDEDNESGRGASLPQSPVSMDRDTHDIVAPVAMKASDHKRQVSIVPSHITVKHNEKMVSAD